MNNTLSDALTSFSNEVTSYVNIFDILGIIGKAFSFTIIISLTVYGIRFMLNYFVSAIHGYFPKNSYEYRHSKRAKKLAQKNGYLLYDDYLEAQEYGYTSPKEYYDDCYDIDTYNYSNLRNAKRRAEFEELSKAEYDVIHYDIEDIIDGIDSDIIPFTERSDDLEDSYSNDDFDF